MSDNATGLDLMGLFAALGLKDKRIEAVLIKPIRNGEWYLKGHVVSFKGGVWGGGHSNYKRNKANGETHSRPYSYSSDRNHWIKKPKVHIVYSIGDFGGTMHSDWVNADNCTFNIVDWKE